MRAVLLFFLVFFSGFSVQATDAPSIKGLVVEKPWVRPGTQGGNTAAYMTLTNEADTPLVITGGASSSCKEVQLHETQDEDGVMKMRQQDSWTIQPGESLELAPGGRHVMLMGLDQDISLGDKSVALTLRSQEGESTNIDLPVEKGAKKCSECCGH